MSRTTNQKKKILLVERILEATDEEHPVSMREILDSLAKEGTAAERKSVYADLEELRSVGMDIVFRKKRPGGYYLRRAASEGLPVPADHLAQAEEKEAVAEENETMAEETQDLSKPEEPEKYRTIGREPDENYAALTLRVRKKLLPAFRSRYGENFTVMRAEEKKALVEVNDVPGAMFYAWLVSLGGGARLVGPREEVRKLRKVLKKLTEDK